MKLVELKDDEVLLLNVGGKKKEAFTRAQLESLVAKGAPARAAAMAVRVEQESPRKIVNHANRLLQSLRWAKEALKEAGDSKRAIGMVVQEKEPGLVLAAEAIDVKERPGDLEKLRELIRNWPQFRKLAIVVGKLEQK